MNHAYEKASKVERLPLGVPKTCCWQAILTWPDFCYIPGGDLNGSSVPAAAAEYMGKSHQASLFLQGH